MLGSCDSPFPVTGAYQAQSPTTGLLTWYDDDEIWKECERMAAEAHATHGKLTMGASLFQQVPFCINPVRLRRPEVDELLVDLRYCRALGVPRAATLDDTPALYADAALIFAQEEQAAITFARSRHAH